MKNKNYFYMKIITICAFDENFGIGKNNSIPWHIKEDFELFKNYTKNNIVVFGKNTWLSLPKRPLLNRVNIVISKTLKKEEKEKEDCLIFESLEKCFDYCSKNFEDKKIFICGGSKIYEEGLKYSDFLYLSLVKKTFNCDTFFPKINLDKYRVLEEKKFDDFTFKIFKVKK